MKFRTAPLAALLAATLALALPAASTAQVPVDPDTDSDGLPDSWETKGVDTDFNGTIDVDLPGFGANPRHKDLFVELDSMNGHVIDKASIDTVVRSFRQAPVANPDGRGGINLHVDNGPSSVMNPENGATWGNRSAANTVGHQDVLGSFDAQGNYDWTAFDSIKRSNFRGSRTVAFRYALSAHQYGASDNFSSGIARGIPASDFIVSLGRLCDGQDCTFGTVGSLAGTFMHEFGHTLGLRHGGGQDLNYKPNYISVMSYLWQFSGLKRAGFFGQFFPGTYDFSRTGPLSGGGTMGALDENNLSEQAGVSAGGDVTRYASARHCGGVKHRISRMNRAVDWNCNGTTNTGTVAASINNDIDRNVLQPFDDWANLRYKAGLIGELRPVLALPKRTPNFDRDATIKNLQESSILAVNDAKRPRLSIRQTRLSGDRVKVTFSASDSGALDKLTVIVGDRQEQKAASQTSDSTRKLELSVIVRRGERVTGVVFDRAANQRAFSVRAE